MSDLREFYGPNAGYVLDLHERYLRDPQSVAPEWRSFFDGFSLPSDAIQTTRSDGAAAVDFSKALRAHDLAETIRARGHTAARLSPISDPPSIDPALAPEAHQLSASDLQQLPPQIVSSPAAASATSAGEAIQRLRDIYSGTVGYEFDHIGDANEREWLRNAVESGRFRTPLDKDAKHALLKRLSQVEGFEKYLHKAFFGQKRFSIEGTDMMVPMIDEMITEAAGAGAEDVVIGMAHRGRLNVLTHVLDKPYALMIGGFAGVPAPAGKSKESLTGDVKYHMGWRHTREVNGAEVRITLSPNPSHLEFVNPVVVGMARAAQDRTGDSGVPKLDSAAALAIVVHGDAAFPGQGVVAETLNMSRVPGFTIGGTIHLIANNQIGFTTLPEDDRSTRYSSDLAKGFEIPIVHVNADDPEACLAVTRLAHAYRHEFQKDFVIDLVGYRRWGHNEGDEPAFTQPVMYEKIRSHATARELLSQALVDEGSIDQAEADSLLQAVLDRLSEVQDTLNAEEAAASEVPVAVEHPKAVELETAVPADRLKALNESILQRPEGFEPNARLAKLLDRRADALGEDGGIDWGHAETLALASLLEDGRPVRLTGQDVERGTFSHRHLVLHGAESGEKHDVLASLPQATASFEIHNSPLSEIAVVGFEYGYTVFDPDVLVIWEAQFGDFANGAQVIIDQFISASYQKWGQCSGLVLLLPHGYEGQGPEHSSARLERFLQLAAEDNLRVANCTTSAQYFHLLRRQAALLDTDPRPLVVMSPKSLLRHPMAASQLEQLATGTFQTVIPDDTVAGREDEITRLLLCSGKVYVDLVGSDLRESAPNVALARVEELYPFPAEAIAEAIETMPALEEIVWVQEEPANMGAWRFVEPRLRELVDERLPVRYAGRPDRASPAEGYADKHSAEQARIVAAAWNDAERPKRRAKKRA